MHLVTILVCLLVSVQRTHMGTFRTQLGFSQTSVCRVYLYKQCMYTATIKHVVFHLCLMSQQGIYSKELILVWHVLPMMLNFISIKTCVFQWLLISINYEAIWTDIRPMGTGGVEQKLPWELCFSNRRDKLLNLSSARGEPTANYPQYFTAILLLVSWGLRLYSVWLVWKQPANTMDYWWKYVLRVAVHVNVCAVCVLSAHMAQLRLCLCRSRSVLWPCNQNTHCRQYRPFSCLSAVSLNITSSYVKCCEQKKT